MPEAKRTKAEITNAGDGPRFIIDADGAHHIVRPGESVKGDFLQAELDDLTPGLEKGAPEKVMAKRREEEEARAAEAARAAETARATADTDAALAARAAEIQGDAEVLAKANDRDALLAIAKDEKIDIETDDNLNQLALKVATARIEAKSGQA